MQITLDDGCHFKIIICYLVKSYILMIFAGVKLILFILSLQKIEVYPILRVSIILQYIMKYNSVCWTVFSFYKFKMRPQLIF